MHFEEHEAVIFNLRKITERLFVFVHPSTGEIIKEINELTTFTRWLLKFHYSFQVGPAGKILVFIIGILLDQIEEDYPDFNPTYIRLPLNPEGALIVYGLFDDDPFFILNSIIM